MEYDLDARKWRFSNRRRNGTELWGELLPDFSQNFQKFIDDGLLIPGWHPKSHFLKAGRASHVSVASLINHTAPGSAS